MTSNQVGFWDSKERKGALSQEADEARRIARETITSGSFPKKPH